MIIDAPIVTPKTSSHAPNSIRHNNIYLLRGFVELSIPVMNLATLSPAKTVEPRGNIPVIFDSLRFDVNVTCIIRSVLVSHFYAIYGFE